MKQQTKLYVAWLIITSYHWNAVLAAEATSTAFCVHELPLKSTKTKIVGYPVTIEIKKCMCGNIKVDTDEQFNKAYVNNNYGSLCENLMTNSEGVCFNKTLNNIPSLIHGWQQYSYAICLFQLTANETYKEISVEDENIFKRIKIDNKRVIDLPLEAEVFIQDGILKKIEVIEGCGAIKYLDSTYYTEKDMGKNLWKKKPSNIETGVDFELNDWFVIPNTTTSDLVGKYEENVDKITENVCGVHYDPENYSFNAKGTIPGSFKPGEEIGDRVDAESFKINTETIEIYENYTLRIENITSDKYFFFDGVIRNACDGNQYLVITYRSHDNQIIRGTIKPHHQESIIIASGENSTKLEGKYTQDQVVGAHVKDDKSTYRMIAISNDTCLEPISKGNTPTAIHIALSFTITLVTLGIVGTFVYFCIIRNNLLKRLMCENRKDFPLEQTESQRRSVPGPTENTDQSNLQTNHGQTGSTDNSQSQNPANQTRKGAPPSIPESDPQIPDENNSSTSVISPTSISPVTFKYVKNKITNNMNTNISVVNGGDAANSGTRCVNQQSGQATTPIHSETDQTSQIQIPNGSTPSPSFLNRILEIFGH